MSNQITHWMSLFIGINFCYKHDIIPNINQCLQNTKCEVIRVNKIITFPCASNTTRNILREQCWKDTCNNTTMLITDIIENFDKNKFITYRNLIRNKKTLSNN